MRRIVVLGATGSVGRVVVPALATAGMAPVALTRDATRASEILGDVEVATGDATDASSLTEPLRGADAVVMVHGATGQASPEEVDYGAVANVLTAVGTARPRIVLMTSMSVTQPTGSWREAMHWKRRGERLLRASGLEATVVRPGWFDLEPAGWEAVVLEQGDTTPVDSRRPVARAQIADAVVASLRSSAAVGKTFELFAAPGRAPQDWEPLLVVLEADAPGSLDAALDPPGPALEREPARMQADVERWRAR